MATSVDALVRSTTSSPRLSAACSWVRRTPSSTARGWSGTACSTAARGSIARCTGAADVIAAVNFARENDADRRRPRRRPLGQRLRDLRRRARDRPVADERDPGRPEGAHRARRGRPDLGRVRPRDAGVRPGGHGRALLDHRHRRPHARQRQRLARAQVRPDRGQPALGRHRHRRRQPAHRERRRERGAVLGPARRRRELRRRDLVRVPPARDRPDHLRRHARVPARIARARCCASCATT